MRILNFWNKLSLTLQEIKRISVNVCFDHVFKSQFLSLFWVAKPPLKPGLLASFQFSAELRDTRRFHIRFHSRLLPSNEERGKTAVFIGYSQCKRGRRRCVLYLLGVSLRCHFSGRLCIVHSYCAVVYCGVTNVDQCWLSQVNIGKPQLRFRYLGYQL